MNPIYNILIFDESSCCYLLAYSTSNLFQLINSWNYFKKNYPNKFLKCVKEIEVYNGGIC